MEKPRPILDSIPERDRVLYCLKCMIEQPIKVLDSVYSNGAWRAPIQCKVCSSIVSRLVHTPGKGWDMDMTFYEERRKRLEKPGRALRVE